MADGATDAHSLFRPSAADLAARALEYNPNSSSAMIEAAYAYAQKAHADQRRNSGEAYFTHPLAVAEMLVD